MLKILMQGWIALTSMVSIILITSPDSDAMALGFVIGLLGQPAWLYSTYAQRQHGMFIVSVVFTYSYLRGLFPALPGLI